MARRLREKIPKNVPLDSLRKTDFSFSRFEMAQLEGTPLF
jgi:hypothetical protein